MCLPKKMSEKRFLNVEYSGGVTARINITDMVDLSEVQIAVKDAFSIGFGYAFIEL